MDTKIFQLRIPEDLHEAVRLAAFASRESMNGFILKAIDLALKSLNPKGS